MSNVLANDELDRRLAAQPPQDEGITLSLDHDECCRLMAILLDTSVEAGLDRPYEALAHYFDHHEGGYKYRVKRQGAIKLEERE